MKRAVNTAVNKAVNTENDEKRPKKANISFFLINDCQKQHFGNAILMDAMRKSFFIHPLMQLLNDPLSEPGNCLLAVRHHTLRN